MRPIPTSWNFWFHWQATVGDERRNWIQRRMQIEAIRNDPDWNNGDYVEQPWRYTLTSFGALLTQSVVRIQELAPTREAADVLYRQMIARAQGGCQ